MSTLTFAEYLVEMQLREGVDDPGVLKCVFMAGGPGSGKSYVSGDLFGVTPKIRASFSAFGLKVVNSDSSFEYLLQANGIQPKDLATLHQDPDAWDKVMRLRDRAKQMTVSRQQQFEAGRLGLLVDGTGDDYRKMATKKQHAESLGYDCFMVFVNTTLDTAMQRNRKRARTLPDSIVQEIWTDVQKNLGAYQQLFGASQFLVVDNDDHKPIADTIHSKIREWMKRPVVNHLGREWIHAAGGIFSQRGR